MASLQTIRVVSTTFDAERAAPNGTHRFPAGLVVGVGEGAGEIDDETARRWVRARIAEPFNGRPGTTVTNADAAKSPAELEAQIATLQALHAQALAQGEGEKTRISRDAFSDGGDAHLGADEPIGRTPYQDPERAPLSEYGLTGAQRAALTRAGFTRKELIDRATDGELLEVDGVSVRTLAKLRGTD